MKHWVGFNAEGDQAIIPDTNTLEDMAFIHEQVTLGRMTRLDESVTIPEIIIKKEVNMDSKTNDKGFIPQQTTTGNEKIEYFMGTGKNEPDTEPLFTPEKPKRQRKPKVSPDFTIEVIQNAFINLHIPERPKGMNKVVIRVWVGLEDALEYKSVDIEWPEGLNVLQAMGEHFNPGGCNVMPIEVGGQGRL